MRVNFHIIIIISDADAIFGFSRRKKQKGQSSHSSFHDHSIELRVRPAVNPESGLTALSPTGRKICLIIIISEAASMSQWCHGLELGPSRNPISSTLSQSFSWQAPRFGTYYSWKGRDYLVKVTSRKDEGQFES